MIRKEIYIIVLISVLFFSCINKSKGLINNSVKQVKTNIKDNNNHKLDTIEIIDDTFVVETYKGFLDYSNVIQKRPLDTLNLVLKKNLHVATQKDTLLTIRINSRDTLNYYLSSKSVFLSGKIYSNKIFIKDSIKVGDDIKEVLNRKPFEQDIELNVSSGVLFVSDFEGFSEVLIDFEKK